MAKKLSEMTLEELWQLFPIFLTEHQPQWEQWYEAEQKRLSDVLTQQHIHRISHIGSTSIPDIWAKPIIDILLEASNPAAFELLRGLIAQNGYICMCSEPSRADYNRGYTETGFAERVFHLHLRNSGDNDELYFRDYLREHHETAREYEKLKLALWKNFEHDRDGYTNAKTDFIAKWTKEAKRLYDARYR